MPPSAQNHTAEPIPTQPRILVINQYALPRDQGGGTRHVELFDRLPGYSSVIYASDRNHTTQEKLTTDDPAFRLIKGLKYDGPSGKRVLGMFQFAWDAAYRALSNSQDWSVVYASTPQPLALLSGIVVSRIKNVPLIIEIRDLWPQSLAAAKIIKAEGLVYKILDSIMRIFYRKADAIVVVTPNWIPGLSDIGIPRRKIWSIPNGSDLMRMSPYAGALHDPPRAVFAGSHGAKDGLHYILDAAESLPDVSFTLIGDGPQKTWAIGEAAHRQLANVRFHPPVPKNDLAAVLEQYDIGIHAVSKLPIFAQGMSPNKLFDYLAVGLPVVSNAKPGLLGVIDDGQCGRLGGWDDLAALLHDVVTALPATRKQWSLNAVRVIESRYARSKSREALLTLLDHVTHSKESTDA
nr:glycosyltransferase family 4 protein [Ornithinimicrobium cryptoxanthini]